MSGAEFAGALRERVTLLRPASRDDLGGVGGWRDGETVWAAIRPDGADASTGASMGGWGAGDDAGATRRWVVTLRASFGSIAAQRLRWGTRTLRVRRADCDPRDADRLVLFVEALR